MVLVKYDVTNVSEQPFILGDHVVTNADGSQSIALDAAGTRFAGQEPGAPKVRNDSTGEPGAYQKFTRQGALIVFVLTPPSGKQYVHTYSIVEGRGY